ncbi:hypothetical protein EVAR_78956_1 [Eumeta japonica]|uniref:Uncharacterized protein n=1 Tax=Eumeta variegata TaxID=151549 RepID=A0A4C1UTE0_EUMVA|nr:hypothetical protein EVAR_78956_1 [Eumeta japonica]
MPREYVGRGAGRGRVGRGRPGVGRVQARAGRIPSGVFIPRRPINTGGAVAAAAARRPRSESERCSHTERTPRICRDWREASSFEPFCVRRTAQFDRAFRCRHPPFISCDNDEYITPIGIRYCENDIQTISLSDDS